MNNNRKMWSKYLKTFEDFEEKGIPDLIKSILPLIRKDLLLNGDKNFKKIYNISVYYSNIEVEIVFTKSDKIEYKSKIDIMNIIDNIENDSNNIIPIVILINDINVDIDYSLSVISHEIRHVYDLYTVNSEYDMKDFIKSMKLSNFYKNDKYKYFAMLIYLSLEHELIARNNMLYPRFRWFNITDKNELYKKYNETYTKTSLKYLSSFNSVEFVNSFNINELIALTNDFIRDVVFEDNFCKNIQDLFIFYKKWEIFFKEKSDEYLKYVDDMLDDVINDINNNNFNEKLAERNYSYCEHNIQGVRKIFKQFYKQIFNLK